MTDLHAAVCQAVSLMAQAPLEHAELIQASDILRNALISYVESKPAGWLNADGSYLSAEKRARMIETGNSASASVGEVTFGKIAKAHNIPVFAGDAPSSLALVKAWRDRINVDPEDPYDHGESDTLMACANDLEAALAQSAGGG